MTWTVGKATQGVSASLVVFVGALALGCGGSGGGKSESTGNNNTSGNGGNKPAPPEVTGEQLAELKRFFDRKRRVVTRCFTEALEADAIQVDQAFITVGLRINPGGSAANVRVVKASIRVASLSDCVVNYVKSWTFPELAKALDYSYRFGFQKL